MVTNDSVKTEAIMTNRMKLTEFGCYEELVNAFSRRCFDLSKVRLIILALEVNI